ncbi:hypothetical protein Enr17x_55840 [Gimesia fumaroli]|uniref:Uncharacterized protein n=1 Tax=Gimesia fumaroli TaxID=2527976 RepID=A0A518IKC8_9PLAN|nr:hypothetical protein Enr17x_55840 [Gimesia fumaroli]
MKGYLRRLGAALSGEVLGNSQNECDVVPKAGEWAWCYVEAVSVYRGFWFSNVAGRQIFSLTGN